MNDYEKVQSCIVQVTQQEPYLTGENVIVAVLDSGIDYFLPEFRNADGQTRILAIWDQAGTADAEQGRLPPSVSLALSLFVLSFFLLKHG